MVKLANFHIQEGSVFGGILLISGSCIGAGMLAIPVITGIAGFVPSILLFLLAWLFMTATGFLLLEANLAVGYDCSLISIAERTLGKVGKILCWVLFLFLFYSLSIAYIAASGSILHGLTIDFFNLNLPVWGGGCLLTIIFTLVLYSGARRVDYFNRFLMIGLILTYLILILFGSFYIHPDYLSLKQWKYALPSLPVLIISFGFHNMIPSLAIYMKGDRKRLRITVLVGSAIPLIIYLLWETVMLGIVPLEGRTGWLHALNQGEAATQTLRAVVGISWINYIAQGFALFAIITSFLAQSLSLVDFLADGLKIPKVGLGRCALVLLTLIPPFILAYAYPGIFIKALNFGGGFSAVILFGFLPVIMVWVLRYRWRKNMVHILPLGRLLLGLIMLIGMSIFFIQLFTQMTSSSVSDSIEVYDDH
ncbi:MAG: aromatic amino acid transport family protein [Chlamydiales bacterium]